jgi:hypothetical protein
MLTIGLGLTLILDNKKNVRMTILEALAAHF